jgi:hypothetical protein
MDRASRNLAEEENRLSGALRTAGSVGAVLFYGGLVVALVFTLTDGRPWETLSSLVWWRVLIVAAVGVGIVGLAAQLHRRQNGYFAHRDREYAEYQRLLQRFDPHRVERDAEQRAELEAAQSRIAFLEERWAATRKDLHETRHRLNKWEPPRWVPWFDNTPGVVVDGVYQPPMFVDGIQLNPDARPERRIQVLLDEVERLRRTTEGDQTKPPSPSPPSPER